MQKQWTIEARADFADKDKYTEVNKYMVQLAVRANAFIKLLAESDRLEQKPQVACFSEDFFTGPEELDVMKDLLGEAEKQFDNVHAVGEVSDDLKDALRDMQSGAD